MGSSTAENTESYIDGEEVFPEEIPAELLERVADNHAHLVEVTLQVKRGKWSTMRTGRQSWTQQPPSTQVHDICTKLIKSAMLDAEKNGEGQRYRARLRCNQNNHEYSRFATVRGVIDDNGAFKIIDDDKAGDDQNPMRVLIDAKAQSDSVSFQAMNTVLGAVKGYASIADSFNKLLCSAGDVFMKHVSGQGELLRIQMEMEGNKHKHDEKMAKMDKGFGLLERPVTRIGDEIIEHVVSAMRDKRSKTAKGGTGRPRPAGKTPTRCGYATTLNDVFADLDDAKLEAARKIMSDDEWKLIQTARSATTEPIFDGIFARFYDLLRSRGDEGTSTWVTEIGLVVGQDGMMKIGMLIQRIEKAKTTP